MGKNIWRSFVFEVWYEEYFFHINSKERGKADAMGYIIVGAIIVAIGAIYTSWAGEYASIVIEEFDRTDAR